MMELSSHNRDYCDPQNLEYWPSGSLHKKLPALGLVIFKWGMWGHLWQILPLFLNARLTYNDWATSPCVLPNGTKSSSRQKTLQCYSGLWPSKQIYSVPVVLKLHGEATVEKMSTGSRRWAKGWETLFFTRQEKRNSKDMMRFKWNWCLWNA